MDVNKITGYVKNAYLSGNKKDLCVFYKEGRHNPALAMFVERDFVRSQQDKIVKNYFGYTTFNHLEYKFRKLKEDKELLALSKDFWNQFKKLYPKTGVLRTVLCKFDRVKIDKVTPKADVFEKHHIAHFWLTHEKNNVLSNNYLIIKK